MILYHGSNVEVREPQLLKLQRPLDFGRGFYTTSDFEQARNWARRTSRLRGDGQALVTVFEADETGFQSLRVLSFQRADADWLRYVAKNRTSTTAETDYDLVIGPVANDQTIRTVNDFIRGRFSEDIAIQLLLPQKLKDQYVFKTKAALSTLRFAEVIAV